MPISVLKKRLTKAGTLTPFLTLSQGGLIGSAIRNQTKRIGYVDNITGEFFCRQRFDRGKLLGYENPEAGVRALINNKIDMFVHDAPVIWWSAARHESSVVAFQQALNVEPLAWGASAATTPFCWKT